MPAIMRKPNEQPITAARGVGLAFLPTTLVNFAAALSGPRLIARFGSGTVLIISLATSLTGFCGLARIAPDSGFWPGLVNVAHQIGSSPGLAVLISVAAPGADHLRLSAVTGISARAVCKPLSTLDLHPVRCHHSVMTVQSPTPFPGPVPSGPAAGEMQIAFDRMELGTILTLYGRMVAAGEWRDYGMSFLRDRAVFSVFRRTTENPLYRIEKRPALRNRQGMYAVLGPDGQTLKRGQDLGTVLRVLERKLIRSVD